MQFDDERVQRFWEGGEVPVATLRLSMAERGAPWRLELVPVFDGFVEGKGDVGSGATWNCAEDADVSDDDEDCLQHWPRSLFLPSEGRWPDRHDPRAGLVSWDVTEDVGAGAHAWLIRTPARHGHNWLFQASGGRGGGAGHGHAGGHRPARRRLPLARGRGRAARADPGADVAPGALTRVAQRRAAAAARAGSRSAGCPGQVANRAPGSEPRHTCTRLMAFARSGRRCMALISAAT